MDNVHIAIGHLGANVRRNAMEVPKQEVGLPLHLFKVRIALMWLICEAVIPLLAVKVYVLTYKHLNNIHLWYEQKWSLEISEVAHTGYLEISVLATSPFRVELATLYLLCHM